MPPEIRHRHHHHPLLAIEGSLAFHVRRYRQWYGDKGISQEQLARIAGVDVHFVQRAERAKKLPHGIEAMLRIAIALGHHLEDVVAPEYVESLRTTIAARTTPPTTASTHGI